LTTSETDRARAKPLRAKLAIVTPWFSRELLGGVEQQSWQLAHQLAARGVAVEVLTTCCASFNDDWAHNALPAGIERSGEITIRRFKVDRRDRRAFARVNAILTGLDKSKLKRCVSPTGDNDARIWGENNLNSNALLNHLAAAHHQFDAFIFMPYLYGTTLAGLPIVAERAFLQPCLHDEAYAYLPVVEQVVHAAHGILFNSDGEFELAQRLFGPGIIKKSTVVGQGVEVPANPDSLAAQLAHFVPQDEKYVLYLGRQDSRKNIGLLVHAFGDFRRRNPMSRLKLVMAGHRTMSFGDSSRGIIDVGPVSESQKAALLSHARALVQPSTMESFSRVIMESWMMGRPVVVNEDCQATAPLVRQCRGGLLAGSVSSWENALHQVDTADASTLDAMGRLGREHAVRYSSWSRVIEGYERVLEFARDERPRLLNPAIPSLQQLCPAGAKAARRFADSLDRCFQRTRGGSSGTTSTGPGIGSLLLVHQASGYEDLTGWAPAHPNAALIYHAATNAGESDEAVDRSILARATAHYKFALASSPTALDGLRAAGFNNRGLLPICVDPRDWDCEQDRPLSKALQDGCTNLVYVGPFVSERALDNLLTAFLHYLTLERDSRLALVGMGDIDDGIYGRVQAKVRSLDLTDRVLLARDITEPQLQSVYRTAHLFWTLDESASFGESLLQAMWFDVPILAYKTPISSYFIGDAGLLLTNKDDLLAVAALAQMLVTDSDLRKKIITAQRLARKRFDAVEIVTSLLDQFAIAGETCA
jgi:glycosyltransferase involved in cell wall biosynthesis